MEMKINTAGSILIILLTISAILSGYYLGVNNQQTTNVNNKNVYYLNMIEIMNNNFNGSMQPKFYLIRNGSLSSTTNITIPSHTLIVMTVISYDTPTNGTPNIYSTVNGTVNNRIILINGTEATGGMAQTMNETWESSVSYIPANLISHTFTVSQIGLNIPIEGGFTEIAEFYINITGTFSWQCMSPCGTGSSGWGGAMATQGWMMGTLYVY